MYQCVGLGMAPFSFMTLGRDVAVELDLELKERIERELDSLGYELVKLETFFRGRRTVLRIFIDRPDAAVSVDDCVRATKALGLLLDGAAAIPGPYNLEISSPGFDRALTKPEHFRRFRGGRARIEYRDAGGGRATIIGEISAATDEEVTITADAAPLVIPFERIARANLHPAAPETPAPGPRRRKGRRKRSGKRL
jgi:ribosome maturation factor RimP